MGRKPYRMTLPAPLEHELNFLGVRAPRPEKPAPVAPPDNGWYKRGEECPF